MESFPGAFPGLSMDLGQGSTRPISPEAISVQKSLKLKKKAFKKDLVNQNRRTWLILSIVCYLYDCSLLLLILRTLLEISLANHRVFIKYPTVVLFTIVSHAILAVIIHLLRELPKTEDDGFLYGHHVIQIIGQSQVSSKYWLLGLDAVIFYLQMLTYSSLFHFRKETENKSSTDIEYDGLQGGTISVRPDFLKSFKPKWVTIDELHVMEEEQRNQEQEVSALARLLGASMGEDYGTMEPSLTN